jgi:ribonuclease HI
MSKYHIYTDGSSRGNPGPGGWGTIVMNEDETEIIDIISGTAAHTTNNQMELAAMICALEYAESHPKDYFTVYSDSTYVVNSCNSWIAKWAANGWRNSKKQVVENLEQMRAIYRCLSKDFFNAEVKKCAGHAGMAGNELADAAATGAWAHFDALVEMYEMRNLPKEEADAAFNGWNGYDWFSMN